MPPCRHISTLPTHLLILLTLLTLLPPISPTTVASPPAIYQLQPDAAWQINLPNLEPFEASGLLLTPDGKLLTLSDRGPEIFEIILPTPPEPATLKLLPQAFPTSQLRHAAPTKENRYDAEGLASDHLNRLYLCEESKRWIIRWDPQKNRVERLPINWSPVKNYFTSKGDNSGFEGVAVSNQHLYAANEREQGRIIEVDIQTLKITQSFEVRTTRNMPWDVHYSDLSWHNNRLYVLCRESRTVLKVNPATQTVEAEFHFSSFENNPEWRYRTSVPLVGIMEGLAVDKNHIWLVTDNNNQPRSRYPEDRRPTLFRCPNPDHPQAP